MRDWLSNKEYDELGEEYIRKYYEKYPSDSLCVDIEGFAVDYLKMNIVYEAFAEDDTDKIGFLADGKTPLYVTRNRKKECIIFPKKTIVIEQLLLNESESGRRRFTIAHEVAHYLLDKLNPEFAIARYHREFDLEKKYSIENLQQIMDMGETRANRVAAALMMPQFNIEKAMEKYADNKHFTIYGTSIMLPEDKMKMHVIADGVGASFQALQIKLKQLGYIDYRSFDEFIEQDLKDGDFDDSDIEYDRSKGHLEPEQIYMIHRSRREAEKITQRTVRCPVCKFKMATVSIDSNGYPVLRCSKCKLNEPLNLAYFRRVKKPKNTPHTFDISRKRKRQSR